MKQKLKRIMVLFLTFTLVIFPFDDFSVFALDEDRSFFEIESLNAEKNEDIVMSINLDLIDYDEFNFRLESSESINNIETDESIDLVNDSNKELSFDFNKNNSNLSTIILKYKVSDLINVGSKITFKAIITDNTNEEEEALEMNYEVLIVDNKTYNDDIKDKVDNNVFIDNSNNNKEIETISLDNNGDNSLNNTNIDSNNILNDSSSEQVVTYNGSDNNYLSSLSIINYDLSSDFSKDRLTYFVTVDSDITSLEINAISENSSSIVSINGNEDLSDGTNKILITVTAENGNTKNYRIYVIKEN